MLAERDVNTVIIRDLLGHTTGENLNATTSRYIKQSTPEQQAKELLMKVGGWNYENSICNNICNSSQM